MNKGLVLAILLLAVILLPLVSHASPLTRTFEFTATDFVSLVTPSPPPPQTTVTGTITVTFDLAVGFSIEAHPDALSLAIAGHTYAVSDVTFQYFGPVNVDKGFLVGVPVINVLNGGTNDFVLLFTYDVLLDTAKFGNFSYVIPLSDGDYFANSVTVGVIPTPEPASEWLMAIAIVGVLAIVRHRKTLAMLHA